MAWNNYHNCLELWNETKDTDWGIALVTQTNNLRYPYSIKLLCTQYLPDIYGVMIVDYKLRRLNFFDIQIGLQERKRKRLKPGRHK